MNVAHAQSHIAVAESFLAKINEAILYPLITLLLAIAVLLFLWGAFRFVASAGDPEARSTGRKHMFFGLIGILIMLSAYAILTIAAGTFDLPL